MSYYLLSSHLMLINIIIVTILVTTYVSRQVLIHIEYYTWVTSINVKLQIGHSAIGYGWFHSHMHSYRWVTQPNTRIQVGHRAICSTIGRPNHHMSLECYYYLCYSTQHVIKVKQPHARLQVGYTAICQHISRKYIQRAIAGSQSHPIIQSSIAFGANIPGGETAVRAKRRTWRVK